MARCLLILPSLPQKMGAPYLGMQMVAAALMAAGHTVRCLDLAAVRSTMSDEDCAAEVALWAPDLLGMTLFTYNAKAGYELLRRLHGVGAITVAGGPHVTVRPEEAIAFGFDLAVTGEGERSAVEIADRLWEAHGDISAFSDISGVVTAASRTVGGFLDDLDALPYAHTALPAFQPEIYGNGTWVVTGGTVTSRGCPARCTFCANYVTGRSFRYRSALDVVAELVTLRQEHDVRNFAFWDDAFTAHRPRLRELCDAMDATDTLSDTTWTCITPANMANKATLERMAASGCVAINYGIESGDASVLQTIEKGQKPQQVVDAVRTASALGMSTVVNFMFGFPGEGPTEIEATVDLMRELSSSADFFNNRGVLVPFPGTPVYEQHHEHFGFTDWWLDDAYLQAEPDLFALDPRAAQAYLRHDPALDLNFFRYDDATREAIAKGVRFKAEHNEQTLRKMGAFAGQGMTSSLHDERSALELAAGRT